MGREKLTKKICKHCKTEIPYGAKVCPQCHKKQGPRVWLVVVVVVIVIALIGSCFGDTKSKDSSVPVTTTAATVAMTTTSEDTSEATSETQNPLLTCAINVADVKNGTGTEVIGKWANIQVKKDELKKLDPKNFVDFVSTKVDGSGYNWFTIIFEDGTGLQFNSSNKQIGVYGKLDDDGRVTEAIGNIILKSDNTYEYSKTEPSADKSASAETTAASSTIPTEYKSALKKAKSYSDSMHMSKSGIYDQLTSEYGEKFSAEAAQYAVDNVDADWNANALAKAKGYSDSMHMSKLGIYDQLTSEYGEKFTKDEAQYAVDHVDADWNANALEKAKSYQDTMNMSPEAIRDQLASKNGEKFTKEEADYAIANLN